MPNAVRIIAEAGVNHNGSLPMAQDLIAAAAEAGADFVKFQTFRTQELMAFDAPKAAYQKAAGIEDSQFDMIKALELSQDDHYALIETAMNHGIGFLSTPFDHGSLDFLTDNLKLGTLKIPSGEVTNGPLLLHAATKNVNIILSTGMSNLVEIEEALGVIAYGLVQGDAAPCEDAFRSAFSSAVGQEALDARVTLLHCTTEYPAPMDSVNLFAMDVMADRFGLPVGYSDHTGGISVAVAAAARGACVIEKHLTLDRTLPGPDHQASIEPQMFAEMVKAVRDVQAALGKPVKAPAAVEIPNMEVARRSLVATASIQKGEKFTTTNIGAKRPGSGVSPMRYWDVLGRFASKSYNQDERIELEEADDRG